MRALLTVLSPEEAGALWADWLVASTAAGADGVATLIAAYVRWLPDVELPDVRP